MFSYLNQPPPPRPPSVLSFFLYLLRHKTVQTNDKLRRFGVVMTPSSMKVFLVMQITAFKAMWRET